MYAWAAYACFSSDIRPSPQYYFSFASGQTALPTRMFDPYTRFERLLKVPLASCYRMGSTPEISELLPIGFRYVLLTIFYTLDHNPWPRGCMYLFDLIRRPKFISVLSQDKSDHYRWPGLTVPVIRVLLVITDSPSVVSMSRTVCLSVYSTAVRTFPSINASSTDPSTCSTRTSSIRCSMLSGQMNVAFRDKLLIYFN